MAKILGHVLVVVFKAVFNPPTFLFSAHLCLTTSFLLAQWPQKGHGHQRNRGVGAQHHRPRSHGGCGRWRCGTHASGHSAQLCESKQWLKTFPVLHLWAMCFMVVLRPFENCKRKKLFGDKKSLWKMVCEYFTSSVGLENDRLLIWHSRPLDVTLTMQY